MRLLHSMFADLLDIAFGKSDFERKVRLVSTSDFLSLMRPLTYKDGTTSLFRYDNPLIHDMIHALKYRGNTHCAVLFAHALHSYLSEVGKNQALLIPVPVARKRKAERGHNQIELILQQLPSQFTVHNNILVKIKNTKPQTSLKRSDRLHNLTDAFAIQKPDLVRDADVILIDDVTTTGTTLKECSKKLTEAGARHVYKVALAR